MNADAKKTVLRMIPYGLGTGSRQERRLAFRSSVILSAAKDLMAIATGVLVEMP